MDDISKQKPMKTAKTNDLIENCLAHILNESYGAKHQESVKDH